MKLTRFNKFALTAAFLIILACGGGGGGGFNGIPMQSRGYYFIAFTDPTSQQIWDFLEYLAAQHAYVRLINSVGDEFDGDGPITSNGDFSFDLSGSSGTAMLTGSVSGLTTPMVSATLSGSVGKTLSIPKWAVTYPFAGTYNMQFSGGDQGTGMEQVKTDWSISGTVQSQQFGSYNVIGSADNMGNLNFHSTTVFSGNITPTFTGKLFFEPGHSAPQGKGTWQAGSLLTGAWNF